VSAARRAAGRTAAIGFLGLAGILALFFGGCYSPTSPNGKGEADISITNNYGEALDIHVDGAFKFTLRWQTTIEMDNVDLFHEYKIDALEPGTGKLIDTILIDVQEKQEYSWTIKSMPAIRVINDWTEIQGQKLAISMDGVFQFNLERGESRMIMKVEFGERFLVAIDLTTGRQVMSYAFRVNSNDIYEWDIKRISPN
jgi:hypothetical protein